MAKKLQFETPGVGLPAVATTTAAFLSGAMLSLAAITIPVFLEEGSESSDSLLRLWARLYHYGHLCMPAISVSATSLFAYAAWTRREAKNRQWRRYAVAGAATITMVPFTLVIMNATNESIFELVASMPGTKASLGTVRELVVKWAWLHAARSMFPLIGAILGFRGVLTELVSSPR